MDYQVSTDMNMDINESHEVEGIEMPSHTTLKVSKDLTDELKLFGRKSETYEQIIWRLLKEQKKSVEMYEKLADSIERLTSTVERLDKKK